MASRLLHLATLASLAIFYISLGTTPVNAVSLQHSNGLVHRHDHSLLAHKKRQVQRRCKQRPAGGSANSTTTAAPSTTEAPPANTQAPATTQPPATTQAPPANNPPPPTGGGGKVGLAWPNGDNVDSLRQFKTPKVTSIYTWSPWKPAGCDELGIEFIPMLWGWKQASDFRNLVKPGFARRALGPNEPDHGEQSAMSPEAAVQLWWEYMEPLKASGYELISPATTSAPSGKTWLQNFVNGCGGCHIDSIAVHWYGTDPQAFIAYLQDFHNTFGRPIYVTEFACQNFGGGAQCNEDQVWNFMRTVTAFMDNTDWVVAYYAFGVMHDMVGVNPLNQLMAGNGGPTALGYEYIN